MASIKPSVKIENARYLKGHASWLYCDQCNKTVAYLCYVTYGYFRFEFECACGSHGCVENRFGDIDPEAPLAGNLTRNPQNHRYCCAKDNDPLFSPVPKNLKWYKAVVVCKKCFTRYLCEESFSE